MWWSRMLDKLENQKGTKVPFKQVAQERLAYLSSYVLGEPKKLAYLIKLCAWQTRKVGLIGEVVYLAN